MINEGSVAVLIPCYNEGVTIGKVVADFKAALPHAEIYVYDNNSTDDTCKIAAEAGAVVRREYRQGKGNVVRTMFRDIEADCYLLVDGDDTYPANHAKEMCKPILEKGYDMVVGDRLSTTYFAENKRKFHNFGNKLVRKLINVMFDSDINDIMSGYRAFSRMFVKSYPITFKGFEIETDMTVFALDKNMLVQSIPVSYQDRPQGSVSKLNTFSDGVKVLRTIFRLYKNYRPLRFFSVMSVLSILVGLGFFIPVFVEYINTGYVLRFPTLFVSLFTILAGILLFCCGLILDNVASNDRRMFELHFIRIKENERWN
ncbi:MAG: glycosyltransferase [Defluviitaleaceae bacterium]|nr:glycosyltransferase [Defluviitaleaceae bacterium]